MSFIIYNILNSRLLYLLIFLFINFMAFTPIEISIGIDSPHMDKAKHFLAFFVLAFITDRSFLSIDLKLRIAILVIFAFMIEVIQNFIGREFSIWDFIFSVIGIISYFSFKKCYQKVTN